MDLKDHEIAQFVNRLTVIGKTYGHTQQLRENISQEVLATLRPTPRQEARDAVSQIRATRTEENMTMQDAIREAKEKQRGGYPFERRDFGDRMVASAKRIDQAFDAMTARHKDDDTVCGSKPA